MPRLLQRLAFGAAASLLLAGCAGDGGAGDSGGGDGEALDVRASFYPLAYAVEQVGGEHVEVVNLTSAGADPHDVELSPRDVGGLGSADLVVYSEGLQPAVDEAVQSQAAEHSLDVNPFAGLDVQHTDGAGQPHDHGSGATDTHFWLDPLRYADVARGIADELADRDPANAQAYQANAAAHVERLEELDAEFETGLASCTDQVLVTGHSAFGYLAERYGFTQVGITGLSPESEPTPGRLAEISAYVREHDVATIYTEVLLDPAVAETVARETDAAVAVLDPLEGVTEASPGDDYLEIMRANLQTLRSGQGCS